MNSPTNITIIFRDDFNASTLNATKSILSESCIYFEKLFANFIEKDAKEITIKVPNAIVSHNIIMPFHKIKSVHNFP